MVTHLVRATPPSEDKELGAGGKPPVDRRPTGGGGGGDDDWKDSVSPHPLLDRVRVVLAFLFMIDMLATVVVMAAFLGRQGVVQPNPLAASAGSARHMGALLFLLFFNAVVLMLSCGTVELARRRIFREIDAMEEWLGMGKPALRNALPWLGTTLGLGVLFLAGQFVLCRWIAHGGGQISPAIDPWRVRSGELFSLAAGIHGAHLGLGLAGLVVCLCALGSLPRMELRQIAVDAIAWYWHTMGLMGLVLMVLLAVSR